MPRLILIFASCGFICGTNVIECDANAKMMKGCYLREFDQKWVTTACAAGYVLTSSGSCIEPCPAGSYLYGDSCKPCANNCDVCFGDHAFQCTTCSSSYKLNFQNQCSLKCETVAGTYGLVQRGSTLNECHSCDSSCLTCFQGYGTACTACPTSDQPGASFQLRTFRYSEGRTESGYCIRDTLTAGYFRQYPDDNMVIQCPSGCAQCEDRYKCTTCQAGFSLYPPASYNTHYAMCYKNPVVPK